MHSRQDKSVQNVLNSIAPPRTENRTTTTSERERCGVAAASKHRRHGIILAGEHT
jgi:hypothetical protein